MDENFRQVTQEAWLICPNWTEEKRFTNNKNNKNNKDNKDKFFEYIFIDNLIVVYQMENSHHL